MASRARINPLSVMFVIGLLAYGLFTVNRHATSSKPEGDGALAGGTNDDVPSADFGSARETPAAPAKERPSLAERFGLRVKRPDRSELEPTSYDQTVKQDSRRPEPAGTVASDQEWANSAAWDGTDTESLATAAREPTTADPARVPYAISGRVIQIIDGDTIELLLNNRQEVRLRLDGIDAPERGQPYANEARIFLNRLCGQQIVYAMILDRDTRWNRLIADVYQQQTWVNGEIVKAGLAWHYKRYNDSPDLSALEVYAQQNRLGLWRETRPVAPWDYRRLDADQRSQTAPPSPRTVERATLGGFE